MVDLIVREAAEKPLPPLPALAPAPVTAPVDKDITSIRERDNETVREKRRSLRDQHEQLGRCHPDTLVCRYGLGRALRKQGRHLETRELLEACLADQEKVLGLGHSDTLPTLNLIGATLYYQNKHAEAEKIFSRAFSARKALLGYRHPDTLTLQFNLGLNIYSQERYIESQKLLEECLTVREEVLGSEHPEHSPHCFSSETCSLRKRMMWKRRKCMNEH